uniref:Uncharacterized protein n=1 Tax=Spermophilus dauricus TaxID=99837 RepID=A0A8C9QAX4_SPEDA
MIVLLPTTARGKWSFIFLTSLFSSSFSVSGNSYILILSYSMDVDSRVSLSSSTVPLRLTALRFSVKILERSAQWGTRVGSCSDSVREFF